MDQTAAKPELLAHAARKLLGRAVGERGKTRAVEQLDDLAVALGTRLSEQAAEKFDVLAHAEIGIEVLAEALRHIGDARADRAAMRGVRHVAAEREHASRLDFARAGDEAQQRRLADPVGPDEADHAAGRDLDRDVVERDHAAITLRDALDPRDRISALDHLATFPCSLSGQATAGSYLT